MSISFKLKTSICDKFCKLIDKNVYEPMLCKLMNASILVFPGNYIHITEQSAGQCDFVETTTGVKFDAKLPFYSKHGKLIASNNRDFLKWLELMLDEETEFGEDIIATRGKNIGSLELYKIMEERMNSIKEDENAIFFFPYPIVLDFEESSFIFALPFLRYRMGQPRRFLDGCRRRKSGAYRKRDPYCTRIQQLRRP